MSTNDKRESDIHVKLKFSWYAQPDKGHKWQRGTRVPLTDYSTQSDHNYK